MLECLHASLDRLADNDCNLIVVGWDCRVLAEDCHRPIQLAAQSQVRTNMASTQDGVPPRELTCRDDAPDTPTIDDVFQFTVEGNGYVTIALDTIAPDDVSFSLLPDSCDATPVEIRTGCDTERCCYSGTGEWRPRLFPGRWYLLVEATEPPVPFYEFNLNLDPGG